MEEGLSDSGSLSEMYIETFLTRPVSVVCNTLSKTLVLTSLPDCEILWFSAVHSHCLSALLSDSLVFSDRRQ